MNICLFEKKNPSQKNKKNENDKARKTRVKRKWTVRLNSGGFHVFVKV